MKAHRNFLLAIAVLGLFASSATPSQAATNQEDQDVTIKVPVTEQRGTGVTGQANLAIGDEGLRAKMKVRNLIAGRAYTVWFVYFDRPSDCVASGFTGPNEPCGGIDLVSPVPDATDPNATPPGAFGRMDSAVADDNGEASFSAKLQDFKVSKGSLIWLFVFVHDPADSDNHVRARQLLTPESPALGAPGLGIPPRKGFPAAVAVFHID